MPSAPPQAVLCLGLLQVLVCVPGMVPGGRAVGESGLSKPIAVMIAVDPARSVDERRVATLLPQMTLEEKQSQTINWAPGDCCNSPQIKAAFKGIGLGALSNGGAASVAGLDAQNELQMWMVNNTQLGIPISFSAETLHSGVGGGSKDMAGNGGGGSVMFPMPCTQVGPTHQQECVGGYVLTPVLRSARAVLLAQGATWNTALIGEVARVIGVEASAAGNDRGNNGRCR